MPDEVAGGPVVSKASSLNFKFSFLNRISLLLNALVTLLSSRGWLVPVQNSILPEKFLGYKNNLVCAPCELFSIHTNAFVCKFPCAKPKISSPEPFSIGAAYYELYLLYAAR